MREEDWGVTCCLLDDALVMVDRLDKLWSKIIFDIDKQLSAKTTECIEQDWGLDFDMRDETWVIGKDEGVYY